MSERVCTSVLVYMIAVRETVCECTSHDLSIATGAHSRMYFAGDTGYRAVPRGFEDPPPGPAGAPLARDRFPACPAFAEVGAALGPFDVALIPIGVWSCACACVCVYVCLRVRVCAHIAGHLRVV